MLCWIQELDMFKLLKKAVLYPKDKKTNIKKYIVSFFFEMLKLFRYFFLMNKYNVVANFEVIIYHLYKKVAKPFSKIFKNFQSQKFL